MDTRNKKRKVIKSDTDLEIKVYDNKGTQTEEDEEEYVYTDSDGDDDLVYLDEKDIKALNKIKKDKKDLYKKFVDAKKVIKSRELGIIDILKANITDEKRANILEQFECFRQLQPCTEEYIDFRDKVRCLYNKYTEPEVTNKPSISPFKKTELEAEVSNFKKKIKSLVCSENNRKVLEEKLEEYEDISKGDEKSKIKRWINLALSLPFDKLSETIYNITDKINETHEFLNKRLFGMKNVKERLILFLNKKLRESNTRGCNIALVGKPGVGKCLHPDTLIRMFDNSLKKAKDIEVGDILLGDDCTPRRVLSTTRGVEEMFQIIQEFGETYIVNKSHILTLRDRRSDEIVDIPLTKCLDKTKNYSPIACTHNIGNIIQEKSNLIGKNLASPYSSCSSFFVNFENFSYLDWDLYSRLDFIDGLIKGSELIKSSERYTDVYLPNSRNAFNIYKIMDLIRSCGIRCVRLGEYLRIFDCYKEDEEIAINSLGEGEYCGFTIDGNERFVLSDWTVTHNTAIAKSLSQCLGIPFAQVSFGGVSNPDFLMGHDYTYVGSRPGEISRCLTRMSSKNGILFFDEFDKASDKKDIMSTLLHITDFSQNNEFRDNYFPELTQDLSKIWFIYSMNELPTDPAMLDRLEVIRVDEYTSDERRLIAKEYLFPKYINELKIDLEVTVTEEGLKKIVTMSGEDQKKGVRDLERCINLVIEKVYFFLCNRGMNCEYKWYKKMLNSLDNGKVVIDAEMVEKVLDSHKREQVYVNMYM